MFVPVVLVVFLAAMICETLPMIMVFLQSILQGSSQARVQSKILRKEIHELTTTLSGISAQDQFSKWARTRRVLDKKQEDYKAACAELTTENVGLQWKFSAAGHVLRFIVRAFTLIYFRRHAMFFLPKDWVLSGPSWVLSLPMAPVGTVSVVMWMMASRQIVQLFLN